MGGGGGTDGGELIQKNKNSEYDEIRRRENLKKRVSRVQ